MKSPCSTATLATLWALTLALPAQESTTPVRRAVVAGVDLYRDSEFQALRGCGNDAKAIASLLQYKFGFKSEEIVVLTDKDATVESLRAALKKNLVDELPADGVGMFYYAGHGLRIPDVNGDETDDTDEALVLHDTEKYNFGTFLVDDEIQSILTSIKTPNVIVVLDTCHSGTANRNTSQFAEFRTSPLDWQRAQEAATRSANAGVSIRGGTGHVVLAACQPHEEANELFGRDFENIKESKETAACGLFTWAFRHWIEHTGGADQPLGEGTASLDAIVTKAVTETGKTNRQRPWFDHGGRKNASIGALLSGKAGTPEPVAASPAPPALQQPVTFTSEGVSLGGAIPLGLKINQRVFKEGEKLLIEATAQEDCYVRLYYLNAEGQVTQLFPNEFHQNNFLPKGKTVRIPGAVSGFDLEMSKPYGVEALKLVACDKQFSDLQNETWAAGLFQQVDIPSLQGMTLRGINAKESKIRYGYATAFYRVLDPNSPPTPALLPSQAPAPGPSTAPANEAPAAPDKG